MQHVTINDVQFFALMVFVMTMVIIYVWTYPKRMLRSLRNNSNVKPTDGGANKSDKESYFIAFRDGKTVDQFYPMSSFNEIVLDKFDGEIRCYKSKVSVEPGLTVRLYKDAFEILSASEVAKILSESRKDYNYE